MSRDLLKEAIADAKAVKETAIANAKAYLEEAFTPQLRTMLATKLEEMDEDSDEVNERAENAQTKKTEDEKFGHDLAEEKEEVEEDLDLDSILKELSEAEAGADEFEVTGVEVKDEESETVDVDVDEEEEEEFNIEELSEDDLKDFISGVIDDMVEAGEIEQGESYEVEDEEVEEEEVEEVDEHQGYDDREDESISDRLGPLKDKDVSAKGRRDDSYGKWGKRDKEDRGGQHINKESLNYQKGYTSGKKAVTSKLNEAYKVIKGLKGELNEINLLNAKLLYTNKIFRSKTLTESQKVKVLSAFDKTNSVKEVKLVFETLSENLKAKKSNIKESMGFASKATGGVKRTRKPIIETDPMVARFQKLAGLG